MPQKLKAWGRQKALHAAFSDTEVPTIEEIKGLIDSIYIGLLHPERQTLRAKALFATYYLTGCRVSEITRTKTLYKQKVERDKYGRPVALESWQEDHDYVGVRKKEIKIDEIDGKDCLIIRTENRKNKYRTTKRQPIPIDKEKVIVKYLNDYIETLDEDDVLFPFGRSNAIRIIAETTGWNIHFIRHVRATHLITLYDFNEQMLIRFMGWTDSRPAKHYMELKSASLFREFYKGDKNG